MISGRIELVPAQPAAPIPSPFKSYTPLVLRTAFSASTAEIISGNRILSAMTLYFSCLPSLCLFY